MERWTGRTALVTGASAGIGQAVAVRLAREGFRVAAVARRADRLQDLASQSGGNIEAFPCDVTKEDAVIQLIKDVESRLGPIAVLVNNAGVATYTQVSECETDKWRTMFELNVIAVGVLSREVLHSMKRGNIEDGYIINISSISSHGIPEGTGKHVYNGTKHALRVITEGLRQELAAKNSNIKVSTICPGVVETEIFEVGGWRKATELVDLSKIKMLQPEEIASAAVALLSTPLTTHIADLVIRPLGETLLA